MSKLHSQLALFGAIDTEVTLAKNELKQGAEGEDAAKHEAVIAMVGKFLPGTTGFGQSGWYAELGKFVNRPDVRRSDKHSDQRVEFPDLTSALSELQTATNERDDRDPVLARAVYGAIILKKIYDVVGRAQEADVLGILPQALLSWTAEQGGNPVDQITNSIPHINDRQSWLAQVSTAVGTEFAERSLSCFGALKKVNGQYCAFITTDTTDDDLKVSDIAKVVEPINWGECCEFFCVMKAQKRPFNDPGYSRVVERISGECKEYYLDTALVFWKAKQQDGSIYINYDLDTDRDNDSGLVEVDSGYIWITPLPGKKRGVRIRTSKLERVSGLSPTATAALACLLGWGSNAHEMLAGAARKYMKNPPPPPPPPHKFQPFLRSPKDTLTYNDK